MGSERREFTRQKVSRVEVRVASQEAFRASYLRDLSMGGLFVRSRQPLPEGTTVVVELAVEASTPVRLRGEVTRQEHAPDGTPRGFGVRFSTVDAETKQALEQILEAHQTPEEPPSADPAELETQLAEARGTIEGYEESLAELRENEAAVQQKLEASQAECSVLVKLSHELQARVQALEAERTALRAEVGTLTAKLEQSETERGALHETAAHLSTDLKSARSEATKGRDTELARLQAKLDAETQRFAALQAELEAQVRELKARGEAKDDSQFRSELQELAAQLDDERLKSMALERALQRFVEMGGVIPKRDE